MAAAASSGEGDRSSATVPRAVVDDLMEVRDRAAMLHAMLHGPSPTPPSAAGSKEVMEGMMSSLSSALSALDTTGAGGGASASSSAAGRRPASSSSDRRRKKAGTVAAPHRRTSSSRRRTQSPFCKTVSANTLDDGKTWRKYGQKQIQEYSPNNPRSYYRCTHKPDQNCKAKRQVQASEANPSEYVISYFGEHTCRDPSTIPLVIDAAAAPPDCANLISFGSTINGASTSARGFMRNQTAGVNNPVTMLPRFVGGYSSSLQAQEWRRGGEREPLSRSSSPAAGCLASVVGLAARTTAPPATVGSAPEYYWPPGDMAGGIGTGSFPSSPSSLGFMTGSFGSLNGGDDDLFGFDS